LFFSATDEFREEDDGEEHQREVADFYALQRSRRAFGPSHYTSSEGEEDVERSSQADETEESLENEDEVLYGRKNGKGIKSSWKGEGGQTPDRRGRPPGVASVSEQPERGESVPESQASGPSRSSKGKGRLVDVDLSDSEHSSLDALEREELGPEDDAPAFQSFRPKQGQGLKPQYQDQEWLPTETDQETAKLYPRPRSPDGDSILPGIAEEEEDEEAPPSPRHDSVWANVFGICIASLFSSAFLVYLHTDIPSDKNPLGDTIYSTLQSSFHLLAVDTLVATIVAALWLVMLRNFLRPLTYLIIVSVPIILFSFALWPLITSYKGYWHGNSIQDKAMRVFSVVPFLGAIVWTYLAVQSRHSLNRAIQILELATKILSASPALVLAGFVTLLTTVAWFWIWLSMFTRVFLEGHWMKKLYVIDTTTWWLGIFFVLMLLWTQMVISGVQRATTAATVSQWYFYRQADPTTSSRDVVTASFNHATGPLLGSVCLSTLISLLIRLPLLILPRRIVGLCSICFYALTPAPLAALTNPLTLTYAAIHSQPLAAAARGLGRLPLTSTPSRSFPKSHNMHDQDPLLPYRTTHLLLHATRQIMTLALGLGAWLSTARLVHLGGAGHTGSMYAYVVGLGAAVVGWGVLGAVEGIIGGVVDGVVVCWGSEVAAGRQGRAFCKEAGELFGTPVREARIEV
jgi:hypothetical protein